MEKIGLVLEGGAMRGVYTAGVLDYLMKKGLYFPYCVGVSAGACQAFSYISKQKGRNREITRQYIHDPRYISIGNLKRQGGIFGFDFIFGDIAKELIPFDFSAFAQSGQEFAIGMTSCESGETVYYYKSENSVEKLFDVCKASSSMPLAAQPVIIDGEPYMDGGIAESIPVRRAFADGCSRVVVILTRNLGYRKQKATVSMKLCRKAYAQYPKLLESLERRYLVYNDTLDALDAWEREGKAFVIRPTKPVRVSRMERNREKLFTFYREGFLDTKKAYENLKNWMEPLDK